MSEVGDNIEYRFVIKNDSNEDYEIDKTSLNLNSEYINYSFETDDNSNIVKANSSKNVTLKVEYKTEVPEDKFENGLYNDNKTMTIQLLNVNVMEVPGTLKNPSTGVKLYILISMILLLVSGTSYVLLKRRKYTKFMILIIATAMVIPVSVYALCKFDFVIVSNIKINEKNECTSFEEDNWDLISKNIKKNNVSCYHVGDTKTVDMGDFGLHTLRISNMSTPVECSIEGFSQTACGFVVEFADIITKHNMNPSGTYKGTTFNWGWNVDGWPESSMKNYVDTEIYNALPSDLKNVIIDTEVISGHGYLESTNFVSVDKLYLLSTHEVWEDTDGNVNDGIDYYDTAYNNTRQLDYYSYKNVTTTNYHDALKYGLNGVWWLRTARSGDGFRFIYVITTGYWGVGTGASNVQGVSPAFRIG